MSHDPILALTVPVEPVTLIAGAVALVAFVIAAVVLRGALVKKARRRAWAAASRELGIDLIGKGSDLGPVAKGRVNMHLVSFAPARHQGRRSGRVTTTYSVKYEAPEAPQFRLTRRPEACEVPSFDTGDHPFDALVCVETDHPSVMLRFLTPARRSVIRRLIVQWPTAEITNRSATLSTTDIEREKAALVDTVCHLVAAAEIFDRPTRFAGHSTQSVPAPVEAGVGSVSSLTAPDGSPIVTAAVFGESDVLTVVRLDEESVIRELFNNNLSKAEIAARFLSHYRGQTVKWSGEIVRVGADRQTESQRIAALIGSADGRDPESGRVVAITVVGPEPKLHEGDVVTFSGTLANLDIEQRLFHLA